MGLFRDNTIVGLDVGQTAVKAACLRKRGKDVEYVKRELLNTREEGILDEVELLNTVGNWLREKGLGKARISVGLPQYLATTQISDFAPNAAGDELDQMVTYETHQLAGLSEESFVSDYQVMDPEFGRRNPVLIGICRESVIGDRATLLENAGIHMLDLSMTGVAVANTFFHFHPEALTVASPQLLIDIGTESSTAIIVAKGQVLFVGSLMVGSQRYTRALAEKHGCSELEAEKLKKSVALNQLDPECPLLLATRQLETELRTAVDHWRAGERPEIANKMFSKLWLSGGGARLNGLANYLSRTYGCEADIFGPPQPGGSDNAAPQVEPEMVTAFGLALQGLEEGRINISLAPPETRWQRERLKRFGYLVAAALFAVALLVFLEFRYYRSLQTTRIELRDTLAELRRCEQLVPQIEKAVATIEHHEKMLIPFVEKGNRARRFLDAIDALAAAKGDNDWFIYMADEVSFEQGKETDEDDEKNVEVEERPEAERLSSLFGMPASLASIEREAANPLVANATKVTEMTRLQSLIVAGYTPRQRVKYVPVRAIAQNLTETDLFENVDLLPAPERAGRELELFKPWEEYLAEYQKTLGLFTSFVFRAPFAQLDVMLPEPETTTRRD